MTGAMTPAPATLPGGRLRDLRASRGYRTAEAFAKAIGMSGATYRAYENGNRPLTVQAAQKMAPRLGLDWKDLMLGEQRSADEIAALQITATRRPAPGGNATPIERGSPADAPIQGREGRPDLPILGHVRGGPKGDALFLDQGEPVAFTYRPISLAGVRDAYAVYVVGDSMHPRYRPGELVYVNPSTPPRAGDDVVIQQSTGEVFLKEFLRRNDKTIKTRQHNPSAEIEYPAATVTGVHVVVFASRMRV